jgi:hypothetical protein
MALSLTSFLFFGALAVVGAAPPASATAVVSVNVFGTADPWFAGQASVPFCYSSCGTLPTEVDLPAGTTSVSFSASGTVVTCAGVALPPDGGNPGSGAPCDFSTLSVSPDNGISGYDDNVSGELTGVFVGPGIPGGTAPATLDFSGNHDFSSLSPLLQQVFFIGDGRTSGAVTQQFSVPAGATRLFLGIPDACSFSGTPSCYFDNSGAFSVAVTFAGNGPVVTGLSPSSGPDRGWTLIQIKGSKLTQNGQSCFLFFGSCGETVYFGEHQAFVFFATPSSLWVLSPPGSGTVDVVVAVDGIDSLSNEFTYTG